MNKITAEFLRVVSDFKGSFQGAFNIRENGECAGRRSTPNIRIETKEGRLFSKTFHRNFNQYLNDARLNYACQRLENTSDSITKICLDSGFESQRTFNRVFKERYKISPSDYRSTCVKEMLS